MSESAAKDSNESQYALIEQLDFVRRKHLPMIVPQDLTAGEYLLLASDYIEIKLVHQAIQCLRLAVEKNPECEGEAELLCKTKLPAVIPSVEAVVLNLQANGHRWNFVPERSEPGFFDRYYELALDCVNKFPLFEYAYQTLGELEELRGNTRAAIAAYKRVLELNPLNVDSMVSLGHVYLRNGKLLRAQGWFNRVLELDQANCLALSGVDSVRDSLAHPERLLRMKFKLYRSIENFSFHLNYKWNVRKFVRAQKSNPDVWKPKPGGVIDKSGKFIFRSLDVVSHNVFSCGFFCAQKPSSALFLDENGKNVFGKSFHLAESFSENLACVRVDEEWGFINVQGDFEIPCQFQDVGDFHCGLAAAQVNNLWGFIGTDGSWVIEPCFEGVLSFSEERAAVCLNDKIAFIDVGGEQITDFEFDEAGSFADGRAQTLVYETAAARRIVKYIDCDGKVAIELAKLYKDLTGTSGVTYGRFPRQSEDYLSPGSRDSLHIYSPNNPKSAVSSRGQFSNGLLQIHHEGKFGIIDCNGVLVIPFALRYAEPFREGLALYVPVPDRCKPDQLEYGEPVFGFINKAGEVVIGPSIGYSKSFSDGVAFVQDCDGNCFFIDNNGNKVFDLTDEHSSVGDFHNGLASVIVPIFGQ